MDLVNILECPPGLGPIIAFVKNGLVPILQIGIPIMLIVLGMLDLGKAVMAGKEDEIKKNQTMLMKRAIAAVAVFFVVTIVSIVMGMFASAGTGIKGTSDWRDCWFGEDNAGNSNDDALEEIIGDADYEGVIANEKCDSGYSLSGVCLEM